jgi:hypothetical protein
LQTVIAANYLGPRAIKCLASTAELQLPKKRTKVEELSTITVAYMQDKRTDRAGQKQKLRVLFDSGCGATLIKKKSLLDTGRKQKVNPQNGLPKVVTSKLKGNV